MRRFVIRWLRLWADRLERPLIPPSAYSAALDELREKWMEENIAEIHGVSEASRRIARDVEALRAATRPTRLIRVK